MKAGFRFGMVAACLVGLSLLAGGPCAAETVTAAPSPPVITEPVPIEQPKPRYPAGLAQSRREGWVDLRYTVKVDGSVGDVAIVDASGRAEFAKHAVAALERWRFEPAKVKGKPVERQNRVVRFNYRMEPQDKGARQAARSRLHKAGDLIQEGKLDEAERLLDEVEAGETNLYEVAHIFVRRAGIAHARNDKELALSFLRRLTGSSEFLEEDQHQRLRRTRLKLELALGHSKAAFDTAERIREGKRLDGDAELLALVTELHRKTATGAPLAVPGRIPAACPPDTCPWATPQWTYEPLRRTISLSEVEGRLDRVEVRCDLKSFSTAAVATVTWTIPAAWGGCFVHVTGEPGARFTLIDETLPPQ